MNMCVYICICVCVFIEAFAYLCMYKKGNLVPEWFRVKGLGIGVRGFGFMVGTSTNGGSNGKTDRNYVHEGMFIGNTWVFGDPNRKSRTPS